MTTTDRTKLRPMANTDITHFDNKSKIKQEGFYKFHSRAL